MSTIKYCSKCGKEISQDGKFCGSCGTETTRNFHKGKSYNNKNYIVRENDNNKYSVMGVIIWISIVLIVLGTLLKNEFASFLWSVIFFGSLALWSILPTKKK